MFTATLSLNSAPAETAPTDDVEAAIRDAVEAFNAADAEAYLASFTEEGLLEGGVRPITNFSSLEEARAAIPQFVGMVQLELLDVDIQFVVGSMAVADIRLRYRMLIEESRHELRLVNGEWLLDKARLLSPEIPAGVTPVPVLLNDCEITFDKGLAASGNIAFQAFTSGSYIQQLNFARLYTDAPLADLLQSRQRPPGLEDLFLTVLDPGERVNLVMTEQLELGRYAFICFVPTPGGPPLIIKGAEFTITGSVAPISPPSTGDGGIVSQSR
jgi:hypothetical protein